MFRKLFVSIALVTTLLTAPASANVVKVKAPKNTYPTMAEVTKVKKVKKQKYYKVTAIDAGGRIWEWFDDDPYWTEGEFAALLMHENGTKQYVYDDIVLEARYCGHKDLF